MDTKGGEMIGITPSYYFCLIGQINRGTCSMKVCRRVNKYGDDTYFLLE